MSRRSTRTEKPAPAESDLKVTPEEGKIESPVVEAEASAPVNIETETPSEDPTPAPEASAPEKIQTDVREKLSNKSVEENIFVPSNPAALEKAATQIAEEKGFQLNRGTSIGARLLARAQKRV
jgi:hypothetical protein